MSLADVIDNDHDKLVAMCDAWLATLGVAIWPSVTFDPGDDKERPQGAEWLAVQLERIDSFARYEYEWEADENDDVEDRVRPSGQYREDFDSDFNIPDERWSGVGYSS